MASCAVPTRVLTFVGERGQVSTYAGTTGSAGNTDGYTIGTQATFAALRAIGVDGSGNLYVYGTTNEDIRKITPRGIVTTVASGLGVGAIDGFAVAPDGTLHVPNFNSGQVKRISPSGATTLWPGTFGTPTTAALDSAGNLYVGDMAAGMIWKATASGPQPFLNVGPGIDIESFAFDHNGNLYLNDPFGPRLWLYPYSGSTFGTPVDIRATVGVLEPMSIVVHGDFLWAPDSNNGNIWTYGPLSSTPTAKIVNATNFFSGPTGIAVNASGNAFVLDSGTNVVHKLTPSGDTSLYAGSLTLSGQTDGTSIVAKFNFPRSVAVDGSGNVFVSDAVNNSVRKITPDGYVITLAAVASPVGLVIDASGNLFVNESGASRIVRISPIGAVTPVYTTSGNEIDNLAIDAHGLIYFADFDAGFVYQISPAGNLLHSWPVTTFNPASVAVSPSGTIYVSGGGGLWRIDASGAVIQEFSAPGNIYDLAFDSSGTLYFTNDALSGVLAWSGGAFLTPFAGSGSLGSLDGFGRFASFRNPRGIAVRAGTLYVADTDNHTVRKVAVKKAL